MMPPVDVSAMLDLWRLDQLRLGRSNEHVERSARIVRRVLVEMDGDLTPLAATKWAIEESTKCSPKTAANRLSACRAFGRFLEGLELIDRNPWKVVQVPRNIAPGKGADPMTVDQIHRLIAAARKRESEGDGRTGKYGPVASFLYPFLALTGLRFGETRAQLWADLDLDEGLMRVTRDKARRRDLVPLAAEAVSLLRVWREHSIGERVFPTMPSHHTLVRDMKTAGIPGAGQWHRFRKTAIQLRVGDLADWRGLVRFARHSDPSVTLRHYDRARAEEVRPVADALPRIWS